MNQRMMKSVFLSLIFSLGLAPWALAGEQALVVLGGSSGLDNPSSNTALWLAREALAAEKLIVQESANPLPRLGDADLAAQLSSLGAPRVFVLDLAPLGSKLIVRLAEHDASLAEISSRRLTIERVEELDRVMPRLARALVHNVPLAETQAIDNLSQSEARAFEKKPGEFLWGLGIFVGGPAAETSSMTPGFDLRFAYEMEQLRINANLGGMFPVDEDAQDGSFRVALGMSYLPFKTEHSPYFGMDFGYILTSSDDFFGHGVGVIPHVGYEFFRLHGMRMQVELGCMLPFYEVSDEIWDSTWSDSRTESRYIPTFYGQVAVLW